MTWIAVTLQDEEKTALRELARREKREAKQQAALLIRQQLERLGLLPPTPKQEAAHERRPT